MHYQPPGRYGLRTEQYSMQQQSSASADEFSVTWTLKTFADHVEPEDVRHHVEGIDDMERQLVWYYGFYDTDETGETAPDDPESGFFEGWRNLLDLLPERKG